MSLTLKMLEDFFKDPPIKDKYEPDNILVGPHWSDEQLKSVIKSGATLICNKETYERIRRLEKE